MNELYAAQLADTEVPNAIFLVPKLFSILLFVAVHTITAPDDDVYSTRTLPLGDAFGWYVYKNLIHVFSGASARAHVAPE
jgi:hypothetical protein